MKYASLFAPIQIRGMTLRNRVVFPAMATNLIADGGYVTDRFIDYHIARVLGGNGLNITEACSVHAPSAPFNFLNISDDKFIPGLKQFTDAIHAAGGKACVQLWQGGIVAASVDRAAQIFVPSDMPIGQYVIPGATVETIREVVQAWGEAAGRAAEAGFDCVEFHAAHGYSPHAFLSAAMNRRSDEYGGSLENRARYSIECIQAIRRNVPAEMPVLMRVVAQDDYVESGLTIEDTIAFAKLAQAAGVDVLDVSRGNAWSAAVKFEVPAIDLPRSFNVANAARIRRETGMTTIAVGRINDPQQADDIVAGGQADMVVMGRAQIADPEFCVKAAAGDEDDIVRCIACNQGCVDRYTNKAEFPHLSCLRNPAVGREREYALVRTEQPKKVLVVGGGMGGMEAAITLKRRGHSPILCEQSGELGGQFLLAGLAPRKAEMRDAAISRGRQTVKAGVDVRLNTTVTHDVIEEIAPDAVVIATGAEPARFQVPGIGLPHVHTAYDIFADRADASGNVVVVGGGLVGVEVAEYLAARGAHVTVIEALEGIGREFGAFRKIPVMESLYVEHIATLDKTECVEIKAGALVVRKDGEVQELPCDHVVIAVGSRPHDYSDIKQTCEKDQIPFYVIGDAARPRRAIDAIHEAAEIARRI